jgi:hypothetical protein
VGLLSRFVEMQGGFFMPFYLDHTITGRQFDAFPAGIV